MQKNFIWIVVFALLLAGCGRLNVGFGPLLRDVTVAPDQISPNADGDTDVTEIRYTLSRSAYISIFFENEEGDQFYFRQNRRRSPGSYSVLWGGVMDEPDIMQVEGGTEEILSARLAGRKIGGLCRRTTSQRKPRIGRFLDLDCFFFFIDFCRPRFFC